MSFQSLSSAGGHDTPDKERPLAAGAAGKRGALLLVDANGAYATCGADPAAIAATSRMSTTVRTPAVSTIWVPAGFPPGYMQGAFSVGRTISRSRLSTSELCRLLTVAATAWCWTPMGSGRWTSPR
jgi:hypothetical protein